MRVHELIAAGNQTRCGIRAWRDKIVSSEAVTIDGKQIEVVGGLNKKATCRECIRAAPPRVVSDYMAKIGKKGGETKGAAKKRSTEHYKRAAAKRWAKKRADNQ